MQGRSCRPARFWEVCLPTEAPLEAEARVRTWRKKYSSYLAGYVHSNLCPIALGTCSGYFSSRNESKDFANSTWYRMLISIRSPMAWVGVGGAGRFDVGLLQI